MLKLPPAVRKLVSPTGSLDLARLYSARALLDFAYAKPAAPERSWGICFQLLDAILERAGQPLPRITFQPRGGKDARQDWLAFQKKLKQRLLTVIGDIRKRRLRPATTAPRTLAVMVGLDEKPYLYLVSIPPHSHDSEAWVEWALDTWLNCMTGWGERFLAQCERCKRFFISLRPQRSRFCSSTCRARASLIRRGYKPPRVRRRAATPEPAAVKPFRKEHT